MDTNKTLFSTMKNLNEITRGLRSYFSQGKTRNDRNLN